ncbi:MAG: transcriptional regulator [Chloroflexota bacterium]
MNMTKLTQEHANPHPIAIKTEREYEKILKEIDDIFDAEPNTPEFERLDLLVTMVEEYEEYHYPVEMPDPISMIEHVMEARCMAPADLVPYMSSEDSVQKIMEKKVI